MILGSQKMFFERSKTRSTVAIALAVIAAGCGPGGDTTRKPEASGSKVAQGLRGLQVVATTTVVADLVRQVAGDRVAVDCLMAAGIDPHSYKATPRDADRLAAADLVVASGLHLEGKLSELLSRLGSRVPVVAVAESLPGEMLLPVGAGLFDPHVWFDAALWARCPPAVAEALARIDAAHADEYRERARAYAARLAALDGRLRSRIETIPAGRRVLVTAHDAFRYFGRAYGIEVVGVQGTSTESEAGLGDINLLVERIVADGIPAVFVETSVSDRNVTAIIEGAAARGHAVAIGGRLHSDSLGGPGSDAETLEAALAANVETIVAGLAGRADRPEAP